MRAANKEEEVRYLSAFSEASGVLPRGKYVPHESPDFLYHREGDVLGIEIQRLFWPTTDEKATPQQQKAVRTAIVEEGEERYRRNGGAPASVCINFFPESKVHRSEVDAISEAIADLVGERRLVDGESADFEHGQLRDPLRRIVQRVWAFGLSRDCPGHWQEIHAHAVPYLSVAELQEIVHKKRDKLPAYRETAHELWLLLVADSRYPPSYVGVLPEARKAKYESGFDRIFFFETRDQIVVELEVQPAA